MAERSRPRVLVADDNPSIAGLLQRLLLAEGYDVETSGDGLETLAKIRNSPPDLILLDLEMPHLDGYEVCRQVKANPATRFIPVLILTGQSQLESKLRAWELGADDFLTKPFQGIEVSARCRSLLRVKRLVDELDSAEAVVFSFARAVEAKSPFTHGHSERVAEYALALAAEVGLPAEQRQVLRRGALLHDIGKISVPDAILNKAATLTPDEFEVVKQHTVQGVRIVEPLRSIRDTLPFIRWHHERRDGQGYPDRLRGEEIPEAVRVLAVVDVYDSLASARPYRGAIPYERCLEMLRANAAGGGLDPDLVERFCQFLRSDAVRPAEAMLYAGARA